MSTILDALRKVERERDSSPDHPLEPQPLAPEVRRRRNIPVTAIAVCAVVGFVGGALLSWWTPSEEPAVEVASLPVPPPPPAIAVPRAPAPEPPAPAAVPAPPEVPVPPPAPEQPQQAESGAAAPPAAESGQQPPAVVAVERATAPAAVAAAPAAAPTELAPKEVAPREALAALGKDGTALERSPFGPSRNAAREAVAPPAAAPAPPKPPTVVKKPEGEVAAVAPPAPVPAPAKPPAVAKEQPEQEVAAVAPMEPPVPEPAPLDIAPEPQAEPEPETSPETVIDTGRSPPGAPKVALSFLQWSADPAKRFAFVSIDGQPSQRIREGESAAGMTVAAITPNGVQFKREGTSFVIRPRH